MSSAYRSFDLAVEFARTGEWDKLSDLLAQNRTLATAMDETRRTLLLVCAGFGGSEKVIRELVNLGADLNHRALDGSNALAAAIVGGSRHGLTTLPEMRALLEFGADPNMVADGGMPALHWAIAQHRPEHVKALLEFGVDLDAKTQDDPPESVDEVVRRVGSEEAIQLLQTFRKK